MPAAEAAGSLVEVLVLLLTILLLSGTEAHLNVQEVVAIIQARDADDPMKHYTDDVRCVIQMSNREEYTTKEECKSIEKRLNEIRERPPQ